MMNLFLPIGLTLDGPLMLGPPIVGLQTKFDDLAPAAPQKPESQKKEEGEFTEAAP